MTHHLISLELDETHPAYQWAKRQSDSVNAFGHIGTHIDCYTRRPTQTHYRTEAVVIDCREGMPTAADIERYQIQGKALVLYTANTAAHQYGTEAYGKHDTALHSDVLDAILGQSPAFIIIDSYGIGQHGDEHMAFDRRCEATGCFVVENVLLTPPIAEQLRQVVIAIPTTRQDATGLRCEVTAICPSENHHADS